MQPAEKNEDSATQLGRRGDNDDEVISTTSSVSAEHPVTSVGPGKDTHGTLGPGKRGGRGWPTPTPQGRSTVSMTHATDSTKHKSVRQTLSDVQLFFLPQRHVIGWICFFGLYGNRRREMRMESSSLSEVSEIDIFIYSVVTSTSSLWTTFRRAYRVSRLLPCRMSCLNDESHWEALRRLYEQKGHF